MTTQEVVRLTGATPRQLQHWDEQGYVKLSFRSAHRRNWTEDVIRRVIAYVRVGRQGRNTVLWALSKRPDRDFEKQYIVLDGQLKFVCATDDPLEVAAQAVKQKDGIVAVKIG